MEDPREVGERGHADGADCPLPRGRQADVSTGQPAPPRAQVQEWGLPSVAGLGCRGWREQEDWWEVCVRATAALLSPRSQAAPGCTPVEDAGGVPAGSLGQVLPGPAWGRGGCEEAPPEHRRTQEKSARWTQHPLWLAPRTRQPGSHPPSGQGLEELLPEKADLTRKMTLGR